MPITSSLGRATHQCTGLAWGGCVQTRSKAQGSRVQAWSHKDPSSKADFATTSWGY